jgi:tetratricopeptide (TPR) repeat protein
MSQSFANHGVLKLIHRISACLLIFLLWGCQANRNQICPEIVYFPNNRTIKALPEAFPPLSEKERSSEWGKELFIGKSFAKELDLYRAVTSFKRSLFLMPKQTGDRFDQVQYQTLLSYYLARRYDEALETFETSNLRQIPDEFETFEDLVIILYDLYQKTCQPDKAMRVMGVLQQKNPHLSHDLAIGSALTSGDIPQAEWLSSGHPSFAEFEHFFATYKACSKSVNRARFLNAALPGAGYYYAGQRSSAITSFLLNAIFIGATYQLAKHDLVFPAIISGSLELGWYFGGINGAGLAAKQYNERLYEDRAKDLMIQKRLFPVLMIQKGF